MSNFIEEWNIKTGIACAYIIVKPNDEHGKPIVNRGGYHICKNCRDAMDVAEAEMEKAAIEYYATHK